MNLKKIGKLLSSKSVGTGPSSYEKRIYRAAVSQRLSNTALQGGLVHIVSGHKKRVDWFCGQWQKTVWLVRNRELTRGLTCLFSYSTANELIFLRISSNRNFVVSSVMVSTERWRRKNGQCRGHFEALGIIQTCRNVSVRSTNRAPNVSCCDSSHISVLLPCSDTALLLAFNSEFFVKVRVVGRSVNSPHIQFCFWPIGILQKTFAILPGSRTVCTTHGELPRSPTEDPQTVEFQLTHAGLFPDCAVLCCAVSERGLEKSLSQRSMAMLSVLGSSTVLDVWVKHGLTV